ncbi:lipoxygenase family protein [Sulfitobacter sp. D35]|uniref:lipoxygenase family protein n=1 Tax=Sulfitobacter sp. D35 TaxID=3083252 RepID=UPI00296FDBF1|nr:lipoxygenase family protein [Sulfitobacter sp. D35]MDW4496503.1 lipoxygenase family protein [Sulfitobacter sp. D35]
MSSLTWKFRRGFWDWISITIFKGKKVEPIPLPPERQRKLRAVSVAERIPAIRVHNAKLADHIPEDEASGLMLWVFRFRLLMFKIFGPMQKGLPEIDADIERAMNDAYDAKYRKFYRAPEIPSEMAGPGYPDLGVMAVESPYAGFLHKDEEGNLVWDFRDLDGLETHDGYRGIGCRVFFDIENRKPVARKIESELGETVPGDADWEEAKAIALCAASTQTSLVAHFNHVHLACGTPFAIATRNELSHDHVICRLIWPHVFGTQNSNYLVTRLQLVKGGSFETMFSFTHEALWKLFDKTYGDYRASVIVPALDWSDRGLDDVEIDAPVQDNLVELYDVMNAHAQRYIEHYYGSDEALRADPQVKAWIAELNRLVPNGVDGILGGRLTRAGLARLIGGFIYMASVTHEFLGSYMWDYQLWVDRNPVRLRSDGKRIPLDVLQKVINGNFNLNVNRAVLMQDLSYFAVDNAGKKLFWQFESELRDLQMQMWTRPHATWRVTPDRLDANINA